MNDYEHNEPADDDNIIANHGWPGDGSGLDDLADHNSNEADDYSNEGADYPDDQPDDDVYGGEDNFLEMQYEDRNGCGYEYDAE